MDEPDAVFELGLLVLGRRDERALEVVEDRQQLLHEPLVRERDELRLLARRPLAVVVEVGGDALEIGRCWSRSGLGAAPGSSSSGAGSSVGACSSM